MIDELCCFETMASKEHVIVSASVMITAQLPINKMEVVLALHTSVYASERKSENS